MSNQTITSETITAQSSFEQTFREYASIYNGIIRDTFTESEEKVVDHLFASKVCVFSGGANIMEEVGISQLKHLFRGFLQAGRKCEIVHFEFLDDNRRRLVEYKTHITGPNNFESMDHSIARIDENNKIVSIEPFNNEDGTARILFQIKFREYFALYDGSPKVFGKVEEEIFLNLFAEDFHVTIDEQTYNQKQWMEAVKTCIEGGMKVDILKFSFLPNSTRAFVYKLRVSGKGSSSVIEEEEGDVILLAVGRVKDGKFASFTPNTEMVYRSIFPNPVDITLTQMNHDCDKENVVTSTTAPATPTSKRNSYRRSGFRFDGIERALL